MLIFKSGLKCTKLKTDALRSCRRTARREESRRQSISFMKYRYNEPFEFKPLSKYYLKKLFPYHWQTLNACKGLQIGNYDRRSKRVAVRIFYGSHRWLSVSDAIEYIEGFYFYHAQRSKFSP